MKEKNKWGRFFKHPLMIGIGYPVMVYFVISGLTALFKKINIGLALSTVLQWIKQAVTLRIPLWIILVVFIIGFIIFKLRTAIKKLPQADSRLQYRKDFIKNWLFVWDYRGGGLSDPVPICTKCECLLSESNPSLYSGEEDYLYCPNCNEHYEVISHQMRGDVEKIILNKLKTGTYKNSPYFKEP